MSFFAPTSFSTYSFAEFYPDEIERAGTVATGATPVPGAAFVSWPLLLAEPRVTNTPGITGAVPGVAGPWFSPIYFVPGVRLIESKGLPVVPP